MQVDAETPSRSIVGFSGNCEWKAIRAVEFGLRRSRQLGGHCLGSRIEFHAARKFGPRIFSNASRSHPDRATTELRSAVPDLGGSPAGGTFRKLEKR